MGKLTTHVLDIARGKPAAGVRVELFKFSGQGRVQLKSVETDADGRCGEPLLQLCEFALGQYELAFHIADYFRRHLVPLSDPPFFDVVVIRFAIADMVQHYHVPLLVSPWSYSTYRGS